MSELTIKDKIIEQIETILDTCIFTALDAEMHSTATSVATDQIMQLIDSAITEAVTKELTERSEDIEQIIDDTYKIGRTDEAMQINDYKTLKPGILKKVQALIDSAITEARIDELEQLKKIRIKGTHHPNGEFDYMWAYAIPEDSLENRIKELKDNTSV